MQNCVVPFELSTAQSLCLNVMGSLWKLGKKDFKRWENIEFLWHCFSEEWKNYTRKVSATWLPESELNKKSNNRHANTDEGKLSWPHSDPKTTGNRNSESRTKNLYQGRSHQLVINAKWSVLRTYISYQQHDPDWAGSLHFSYAIRNSIQLHFTSVHNFAKKIIVRSKTVSQNSSAIDNVLNYSGLSPGWALTK